MLRLRYVTVCYLRLRSVSGLPLKWHTVVHKFELKIKCVKFAHLQPLRNV